jgi:hypothetical protein
VVRIRGRSRGSGDGVGGGGLARGRRSCTLQCALGVCRGPRCIDPRVAVLQREMGQQVEICYASSLPPLLIPSLTNDAETLCHREF